MSNLLKINWLLILVIGVAGCRKDPPPPPIDSELKDSSEVEKECPCCTECEDFPKAGELGWFFEEEGVQFKAPCFNPNNSSEFVYLRMGLEPSTELVKYDMVSETETVLCNSVSIITQPQWGEQGWILFTSYGNRIWKIFEDGTGLEQITDFNSVRPAFTIGSERFVTMGGHPEIVGQYRPVMDLNGNLVDSILYRFDNLVTGYPYISANSSFKKSYQLFVDQDSPSNSRRGISLVNNDIITELNSINYYLNILDFTKNDGKIFYSSYWDKLFVLDLATFSLSVFRSGCKTVYYNHIDMSPTSDKILVQKVISTVLEHSEVSIKHEIWLLDIYGCNDQKILGE